jgi:hypothetical protein
MEMSDHNHASLSLLPGKVLHNHFTGGCGGYRASLDVVAIQCDVSHFAD